MCKLEQYRDVLLEMEEYETREQIFRIEFDYDFENTVYDERNLMFQLGRKFKGTRKELDKALSLLTENKAIRVKDIRTFKDVVDYIANIDFKVETKSTIKTREMIQRQADYKYLKSGY